MTIVEVYFHSDYDYPGRPADDPADRSAAPCALPRVKHDAKLHQHDTTIRALESKGLVVQYLTCPIGRLGVIFDSTEQVAEALGIPRGARRDKLYKELHVIAVKYAHALIRYKRQREAGIPAPSPAGPAGSCPPDRPSIRKRKPGSSTAEEPSARRQRREPFDVPHTNTAAPLPSSPTRPHVRPCRARTAARTHNAAQPTRGLPLRPARMEYAAPLPPHGTTRRTRSRQRSPQPVQGQLPAHLTHDMRQHRPP